MKIVEFGFSNDNNPTGSFEGIGINENLLITEADYYGTAEYDSNAYLIAKTNEKGCRYPELLNKFIVRPALADLYPDGSGIIFLNKEQSEISKQIENYLNSEEVSSRINNFQDILSCFKGLGYAKKAFDYLTLGNRFLVTSILPEEFERKNEALKQCSISFSELSLEYQELKGYHK